MNKTNIFLYVLVLMFTSCASKELTVVKSDREDLVKTFDLDDDEMSKFVTTKVTKKSKKKNSKKKKVKKRSKWKKTKKITKTKEATTKKVVDEAVKEAAVVVDPTLNKDYPEILRQYNKKYVSSWGHYKPLFHPGEKFHLKIRWSFFTAGIAVLESLGDLEMNGTEVYGFKAELNSAKYFESVYKLRDTLVSYVTKDKFLPLKYVLKQRESGQNVDDLQVFDHEKLKTYFWYNRLKKGKVKKYKKEAYLPRYFTDSFSALYFLRGLPFEIGRVYEFPVITRTKVWILKAEVSKIETIEIMGKDVRAYKIKAETRFPGVLKKKGDILFWYSADSKRKLLKFEAKVKIGTVKGVLEKYEEGSPE